MNFKRHKPTRRIPLSCKYTRRGMARTNYRHQAKRIKYKVLE